MISIDNLSYKYPSSSRYVIDRLSMDLVAGNVCGLLGENGVGKTTLLGLMCGILRPTAGSVKLEGVEVSRRKAATLAEIFYVPDETTLPHISLENYVKINSPFYPRFSREVLDKSLQTIGLDVEAKNLDELSLGQRKKVILCFAIASGAKVVLMDEPTNGLDIPSKGVFRKVIAQSMTDDRLFVISTHQVHDVEQILDQIVIMDNNRVLLNDTVASLTSKYAFGVVPTSVPPADAIYAQPAPGGMAIIRHKTDDEDDTQLDLELLFGAAIQHKL